MSKTNQILPDDRQLILDVVAYRPKNLINTLYMGGMATAHLMSMFGLLYGQPGLEEAVRKAPEETVNQALSYCLPYIQAMREYRSGNMDLSLMTDANLIRFKDDVSALHTGSANRTFRITKDTESGPAIMLKDKRFNDLLFELEMEAIRELRRRFSDPICRDKENSSANPEEP